MHLCKSILLVDSQTAYRDQLANLLSQNGYKTQTTNHPHEALALMQKETFQLVLTELILPDMDGVALCKAIKKISPQTIVYALSAHIACFGGEQLERDGVDGFLMKPVNGDILLTATAGAFSKLTELAA